MDHVLAVRCFESTADLKHDARRFIGRKFAFIRKKGPNVPTLHKFHSDEFDPVGLPKIKNSDDILVGDLAREYEFLLEASQDFGIAGELRTDQLESNKTVEFLVPRFIDRTHPTASKQLQDFITARQ